MKPLRAADLRHQISIRRSDEVDDGRGGYSSEWSTVATPWAEVTGLDGRESVMEHVLQGVSVFRIRIWYRDGIAADDQIRHAGQDLNIRSSVDPFGTRRELLIIADTRSTLT